MTSKSFFRKALLGHGNHTVLLGRVEVVPSRRFEGTFVRKFLFSKKNGEISRKIALEPRAGTDPHRFVESLFGRTFEDGEEIDYSLIVGNKYTIVVTEPENGPRLIESATLIKEKQKSKAASE